MCAPLDCKIKPHMFRPSQLSSHFFVENSNTDFVVVPRRRPSFCCLLQSLPKCALASYLQPSISQQYIILTAVFHCGPIWFKSLHFTHLLAIFPLSKQCITVVATPLTVLASPVNLPNNSQCFAELDATADTLSVPLNHHSIYISINDSNGNDPNRINNIIVTVATTPDFGKIPSHLTTQLLFHFKVINSSVMQYLPLLQPDYNNKHRHIQSGISVWSCYFWSDFVHGMHPSHSTSNKEYIPCQRWLCSDHYCIPAGK